VLIGAMPEGRKELVGFTDRARESGQDWRDLLLELRRASRVVNRTSLSSVVADASL
jgi:transposase-like protein